MNKIKNQTKAAKLSGFQMAVVDIGPPLLIASYSASLAVVQIITGWESRWSEGGVCLVVDGSASLPIYLVSGLEVESVRVLC